MSSQTSTAKQGALHVGLFFATALSVYYTYWSGEKESPLASHDALRFAGALMLILLAHELGHFIAARLHRVPASLPFFIPLPLFSPFGTMGAIIRMSGRIPTRKALLDIGAAGPLAGLVFAIPLYAYGLRSSSLIAKSAEGKVELGTSLLLALLEKKFGPSVPEGMDILLSPVAFAAWAGMFVTFVNLLPLGQLDGGHVAYALFGRRQLTLSPWIHRTLLVLFSVSLLRGLWLDYGAGIGLYHLGDRLRVSAFWLFWFELLAILRSSSGAEDEESEPLSNRERLVAILGLVLLLSFGRDVHNPLYWVAWMLGAALLLVLERRSGVLRDEQVFSHPETSDDPLSPARWFVGVLTLLFFVLLFLPVPMSF